jgi:hypothetical protein
MAFSKQRLHRQRIYYRKGTSLYWFLDHPFAQDKNRILPFAIDMEPRLLSQDNLTATALHDCLFLYLYQDPTQHQSLKKATERPWNGKHLFAGKVGELFRDIKINKDVCHRQK